MKKIFLLATAILLAVSLASCGGEVDAETEFKGTHAVVVVTASNGLKEVRQGYNDISEAINNPLWIEGSTEVAAKAYFYCTKCEHEETKEFTLADQAQYLFRCDCSNLKNGWKRKYFLVATSTTDSSGESSQ